MSLLVTDWCNRREDPAPEGLHSTRDGRMENVGEDRSCSDDCILTAGCESLDRGRESDVLGMKVPEYG